MTDSTPGWQPDPTGKHDHRYWDGEQWTENVSDAGVASIDAYEAPTVDEPTAAMDAPADEPAPVDEPTVVEPAPAADTTAAWPTAAAAPSAWPGATADPGAPAPPPPYVPTQPVSSGGGGSKKGLLVGGGILAAVAIAVIAFLALGGDDESTVRADLASKIREESEGELSGQQADCIAGLLVDEKGEGAFEDVDYDADEAPQVVLDAFEDIGLDELVDRCDIDLAALGGGDGGTDGSDSTDTTDTTEGPVEDGSYGSDPELDALYDACEEGDYAACDQLYLDSPAGSEYETFGDTCGDRNEPSGYCEDLYADDGGDDGGLTDGTDLSGGFDEDALADIYETSLNLDRDQAECLAGKIMQVIEDGTIEDAEAMSEVMNYLSDCDISLEEISGN